MDYTTLGRTGIRVSVAGLGAGGASRLGQSTGRSEDESIAVVHRALDLGVNFIDTSEAYGTEELVGRAIAGRPRDQVVLSSKVRMLEDGRLRDEGQVQRAVEAGLRRLGTDYVDVLHLHGVRDDQYVHARNRLLPALVELRDKGLIRATGVTEAFGSDAEHRMMSRAADDGHWDVAMVGYNMLNQSARERVFPGTVRHGVGVLIMFAVRRVFSDPDNLRDVVAELVAEGHVDADAVDPQDPLGFLAADGDAESVTDAAYRFCRHEPAVHVTLFGTGNAAHVDDNVASILRPPLPDEAMARLTQLFGRIDHLSGN